MERKIIFLVAVFITATYAAPAQVGEVDTAPDLICELCHIMVRDLKMMIGENATEAEVEGVIDDICNRLASGQETCTTMVHQYLPGLFDKISGNLDPETACQLLEVCPTGEPMETSDIEASSEDLIQGLKLAEAETKMIQATNTTCSLCEFVIQYLDAELTVNSTEQQINVTLLGVCKEFDSFSTFIGNLCRQIEPALMKKVNDGLIDSEKACSLLKLCNQSSQAIIESNLSEMEEPEQIGSNRKGTWKELPQPVSVEIIEAVQQVVEKTKEGKSGVWKNQVEASNATCEICEFMIKILDTALANNRSEPTINNTLWRACDALNGLIPALGSLCYQVEPNLLKAVEAGVDPEKSCTSIRMCNEAQEIGEPEPAESNVSGMQKELPKMFGLELGDAVQEVIEKTKKGNPVVLKDQVGASNASCLICEFMIKILDTALANNRSEPTLNNTLWRACDALNGLIPALGSLCYQVEPNLLKAMEAGVDPEKACTSIRMCNEAIINSNAQEMGEPEPNLLNAPETLKLSPKLISVDISDAVQQIVEKNKKGKPVVWKHQVEASNATCEICEFMIQILDAVLANNRSEPTINSTLWRACDALNGLIPALGSLCYQIEPNVLKAMEAGVDPEKACTSIRLCNEENNVVSLVGLSCDVCKSIMREVAGKAGDSVCDRMQGVCVQAGKKIPKPIDNMVDSSVNRFVEETQPVEGEEENFVEPAEEQIEKGEPEANPIECAVCKFLVEELEKKYLTNKTYAEINATILSLCGDLPNSIQSFCLHVAPTVVNFLINGASPSSLCADIRLCAETSNERQLADELEAIIENPASTKANPVECSICEVVVDELEKRLPNNTSPSAVNATIYQLCNELPPSVRNICTSNAQRIVSIVVKEINQDPSVTCADLKLCDANMTEEVDIQPKEEVTFEDMVMAPGDDLCEACEFVVNLIDQWLVTNKSAVVINSTVNDFCNSSFLPKDIKVLCKAVAPELITVLEKGFNATDACITVKFCNINGTFSHESLHNKWRKIGQTHPETQKERGVLECATCEFMLTIVDELVHTNTSKTNINLTLYEVCQSFPPEVKQFCYQLTPKVVNEIENGWNPTYLCDELRICNINSTGFLEKKLSDAESDIMLTPEEEPKADARCELCEFFIKLIDDELQKGTTIQTLNGTLSSVCKLLPAPVNVTCKAVVPEILSTVAAGVEPSMACKAATYCPNNTLTVTNFLTCKTCHGIVEFINPEKYSPQDADSKCYMACHKRHRRSLSELKKRIHNKLGEKLDCTVCEFLRQTTILLNVDIKNEKTVEKTMENVCKYLPSPYDSACMKFAAEITNESEHGLNEVEFCSKVTGEKCDNVSATVRSLLAEIGTPENMECNICVKALSIVTDLIDTDIDQIKKYIDNVCERLPNPTNDACHGLVQNGSQEIIDRIIKKLLNPEKVCQMAHVCPLKPANYQNRIAP